MTALVSITPAAQRRIAALLSSQSGKALRLSVSEAGCAGKQYDFEFVEAAGPHDEKVVCGDAIVHVDPLSLIFIIGTEIDWIENGLEKKFAFANPNQTGECGCGQSFYTG